MGRAHGTAREETNDQDLGVHDETDGNRSDGAQLVLLWANYGYDEPTMDTMKLMAQEPMSPQYRFSICIGNVFSPTRISITYRCQDSISSLYGVSDSQLK
jgi:hypothetical protein